MQFITAINLYTRKDKITSQFMEFVKTYLKVFNVFITCSLDIVFKRNFIRKNVYAITPIIVII